MSSIPPKSPKYPKTLHSLINPKDLHEGLVLSQKTITAHKRLFKENGSPKFFKIDRKEHPELFGKDETPRSSLFMNGNMFITYRDKLITRDEGYLGFRHGGDLVKNSGAIKIGQDADTKEWVAIRIHHQRIENEIKILDKLGRLRGYMERHTKRSALKIYTVEPLLPGDLAYNYFKANSDGDSEHSLQDQLDAAIIILRSLQRFHDLGTIHGDAGWHNIMYDPKTNTASLFDFEASKLKEEVVKEHGEHHYHVGIANDNSRAISDLLLLLGSPFLHGYRYRNQLLDKQNEEILDAILFITRREEQGNILDLNPTINLLSSAYQKRFNTPPRCMEKAPAEVRISPAAQEAVQKMKDFMRAQHNLSIEEFVKQLESKFYATIPSKDVERIREEVAKEIEQESEKQLLVGMGELRDRQELAMASQADKIAHYHHVRERQIDVLRNRQFFCYYPSGLQHWDTKKDVIHVLSAYRAYQISDEMLSEASSMLTAFEAYQKDIGSNPGSEKVKHKAKH